MKIGIIGGGLAGLSAAYELQRGGAEFEIFEAEERLGGYLRSSVREGFLIEHGADSWIAGKPWLEELACELGMADEIVASPVISPSTHILRKGELLPLPAGLSLFAPSDLQATDASPLFSDETKRRFHQELAAPPEPLQEGVDESVAEFAARHFGQEVVKVLAAPLLAGVYGGDAQRLSARAVVPGLVELEAKHGSLIRGVQETRSMNQPNKGTFRCLRGGMESLARRLHAQFPSGSVRLNTRVSRIQQRGGTYDIHTTGGVHGPFGGVIVATAAPVAAQILGVALPGFQYSSVATIALAYDISPELPGGFGFLVAAAEPCAIMAATFVQQKWPARVPAGKSLIRVFVSDAALLLRDDATMVQAAQAALAEALGIDAGPAFAVVDRWPKSMPQYEVGHVQRVGQAREMVAAAYGKGVLLAGNSYDGIGMPDAVRSGRAAARVLLES